MEMDSVNTLKIFFGYGHNINVTGINEHVLAIE